MLHDALCTVLLASQWCT